MRKRQKKVQERNREQLKKDRRIESLKEFRKRFLPQSQLDLADEERMMNKRFEQWQELLLKLANHFISDQYFGRIARVNSQKLDNSALHHLYRDIDAAEHNLQSMLGYALMLGMHKCRIVRTLKLQFNPLYTDYHNGAKNISQEDMEIIELNYFIDGNEKAALTRRR